MNYIVVIIPSWNFYKILFKDKFIDGNVYKTQNLIIEVLQTLGLKREDFVCDLWSKTME